VTSYVLFCGMAWLHDELDLIQKSRSSNKLEINGKPKEGGEKAVLIRENKRQEAYEC